MEDNKMNLKSLFDNWIVKNLIWAVVAVFALILALSIGLRVITHHNKTLTVPDFTNMKVSEAKYNAEVAGLRVDVVDSVYVRRLGRGLVYSQNPKPGDKVKKGRRILLTINSVVPKKVQMPNLVGFSIRQAKAELLSRGLTLNKLIYVSDMATNNVLRQLYGNREAKPGRAIESGAPIDLVVGLNSEDNHTLVPSLTGMKYLRAVDAIHDYYLNVGKLVFDGNIKDYGDSLDAFVYKQVPAGNRQSALMGSEVSIYLTLDESKLPNSKKK